MKRTTSIATIILLLLLSSAATIWGQQVTKRLQFPRGRTTAVVTGRTNAHGGVVYLLRARKGQHMTVHVTSPKKDVSFQISPVYSEEENPDPLEGAVKATDWEGDLPDTSEYSILVSTDTGTDTYTLEVTIR